MKRLGYEEYAHRVETINAEYAWVDGEPKALIAYPLYIGVKAGEIVSLDFNQTLRAPMASELYELWHVVLDGVHYDWIWCPVGRAMQ